MYNCCAFEAYLAHDVSSPDCCMATTWSVLRLVRMMNRLLTSADQFLEGSTHLQKIRFLGKLDFEFVHQVKVSNAFVLSNS